MYLSFYFNYLFGHLCVHNWACEGILKASIIRKYFGGKQQNMRNKVILGEDGFLGPYDCIFSTDDTHHMWNFSSLSKFILCCYSVKINHLGSKVNTNKCGHQVNFNW